MPESNTELEIRSNEMQEIIGQVPHWITRWGIIVLCCVGVIGIIISNYIHFPEILPATVFVQAKEQPGQVTVRREDASQEFKLRIKNGQIVNVGDTLLIHKDNKNHTVKPILTPMKGKIYISNGIDQKNTLDYVIWVVPATTGFEIKLKFADKGAGGVKVGQAVQISLTDYPPAEYGFLEGRISSILPMQVDNAHQGYITLKNNKLITSKQIEIPVLPVMNGDAEILLNDKSIFQRIFRSIL